MSVAQVRRTKIVCTIGPASADSLFVEQLAWSGMDAARLNFSHGEHDEHLARLQSVRRAQEVVGRPLAVIADLQGPKIRIGKLAEPRTLNTGDRIILCAAGSGGPGDVEVTFPGLAEVGGTISSGKGVNLPGTRLPIPSLTGKDRADLEFALAHGVDYIALSFVRTADDVNELRELIRESGSAARVIAKIEKREAIENLEQIVEAAQALMVARGDLGVEIGVADVPLVQKLIIRTARSFGRTVITATQMLESMIRQPEPTRAEVSDVANAILDGTSAVMLSGETAVGRYPLEAVEVMSGIARAVEPSLPYHDGSMPRQKDMAVVIAHAACDIAEELGSAVIAVPTQSGATARQVSRFRPRRPIVAASPSPQVLQQLALAWGVVPVGTVDSDSIEALWDMMDHVIRDSGLAGPGDRVVLTGGTQLNRPGATDHIVVRVIE